jgi:hypothetical protein
MQAPTATESVRSISGRRGSRPSITASSLKALLARSTWPDRLRHDARFREASENLLESLDEKQERLVAGVGGVSGRQACKQLPCMHGVLACTLQVHAGFSSARPLVSSSEYHSLFPQEPGRWPGMPPGRSSLEAAAAPAPLSNGAAVPSLAEAAGGGGRAGGGGDEDHIRDIVETCLLTDDLTPLLRLILLDGSSTASKGGSPRGLEPFYEGSAWEIWQA